MKYLRIVPPAAKPGSAMPARGTRVLGSDGVSMPGVTKVELVAEVNGVWQAKIHCAVVVDGEIVAHVMPPETVPPAMQRIEAKLDALLEALADEEEVEESALSLDGDALGGERDLMEPL